MTLAELVRDMRPGEGVHIRVERVPGEPDQVVVTYRAAGFVSGLKAEAESAVSVEAVVWCAETRGDDLVAVAVAERRTEVRALGAARERRGSTHES